MIKEADTLANKARKLQEKLNIQNIVNASISKKIRKAEAKAKKKVINGLNYQQLIEAIRAKPIQQIVKFCVTIAGEEEKRVVDAYFNRKKLLEYKPTNDGADFLMFLYQLLPKEIRKNFFLFVKNQVKGTEAQSRLIKQHPSNFYTVRIDRIALSFKIKSKKTQIGMTPIN